MPILTADLATVLSAAFCAGALTQLARQLSRAKLLALRRTLALGVLGGVAALSVVALLSVSRQPAAPLLLAAACVSGWSGPSLLGRLGRVLERRLAPRILMSDLPKATETTALSPTEKAK